MRLAREKAEAIWAAAQRTAGAGRRHHGGGRPRDSRQARIRSRRHDMLGKLSGREHLVHTGIALRTRQSVNVGISTTRVAFAPLTRGADSRLLGERRAAGQGRRLRDPGAGRGVRVEHFRQLHRRHGPAAVRNGGNCCARRACRCGTARWTRGGRSDHGNSHQRGATRKSRGAHRKRRADGAVRREAEPARHRQQSLQGSRAARVARHAGGIHRRGARAHGVPARRGHRPAQSRKHADRSAERSRTSAASSRRATTSSCRWSRTRWAPRARA